MILEQLFLRATGERPVASVEITGSGSSRRYCRLAGQAGDSVIGTVGTDLQENRAFIYLSRHFRDMGLNVPEVIAESEDGMAYLQTDLGGTSLYDVLRGDPESESTLGLLRDTVSRLPDIQFRGARGLDFSRCYPVSAMDRRSVMWDLNYFKYMFLKLSDVDFNESALEDDMQAFASMILSMSDNCTFMYRDFQSRNVMVHDGSPWFIDFQGGRRGPALYDLASFLWQARAGFSDELRRELAGVYLESARRYHSMGTDREFELNLRVMALFRTMQVLGAYGCRGVVQQKVKFIESIPRAVDNLRRLLEHLPHDCFPELSRALHRVCDMKCYALPETRSGLTVTVSSFGFRKSGIPRDYTGNGGGFVFDCRAVTNPGRYAEYVTLTGLDAPVIEFLEKNSATDEFFNHARELVGSSVRRYIDRGFSNLMVSFGCTGGRHRSVYFAQRMARWISETFGVRVELHHRERAIDQIFEARWKE